MGALVPTILAVLEQLLPAITGGNATLVGTVLKALIEIIPLLTQEYADLVPIAKNIISALSANPATTAAQMATLQALDKQCDDAFEAAAAAAQAEDGP